MINSEYVHLVELFPSPLLQYLWPNSADINQQLARLILSKRAEHAGVKATNSGGWHSKRDLREWDGECIKQLLGRVYSMADEMMSRFKMVGELRQAHGWKIQAWANVNGRGDFNRHHNHVTYPREVQRKMMDNEGYVGKKVDGVNIWSGVYYVDIGINTADVVESARLIFSDENAVKIKGRSEFNREYAVAPRNGLMVLFPSFLGHSVEPHSGTGDRITIAFNLKHDDITTVKWEMDNKSALC